MPISLLAQNPLYFIAWVAAILIALTFHEFSHALVANFLGDQTAKRMGRLSLNPLVHLDPIGFLALVLIGFGWGKPVPYNPYNLRYPKWGSTLVAAAGPVSNLVMIVIFGLVFKFVHPFLPLDNLLLAFLELLIQLNLILCLFNLIPVPPLDGSKFLLSALAAPEHYKTRFFLETRGPLLLLGLILLDSLSGLNILSTVFSLAANFTLRLFA
jgi:Zn-dependent protease